MKTKIWIVAWILLLMFSDLAYPSERELTSEEKAKISDAVKEHLSDPDSAMFRWPPRHDDDTIYCGLVNAKNRFGGYVGYTPFSVSIFADGKVDCGQFCLPGDEGFDGFKRGVEVLLRYCKLKGYFRGN